MSVVFPYQPSGLVRLQCEYQTQVQFEDRGSEHRVPFADQIRYNLRYQLLPEDEQLQDLRKALEDLRDNRVKVPDWTSGTFLTATAAESATSLSVDSLPRDWNVKEAILLGEDLSYEVVTLSQLPSGSTVSLATGLDAEWPDGTPVLPLRAGILKSLPRLQGISSSLSAVELEFQEDYGNQLTTGAYKLPGQFKGRPILSLSPDFDGPIESYDDRVEPVTLGFGNPDLITETEITIRRLSHQYRLGQVQAEQLVGVFAQSLGRVRSFWLPSFRSQWRLAEDVVQFGSTLKLEQDGFLGRWENRDSDKFLAIVVDDVVSPVEVYKVESSGGYDVVYLKDQVLKAVYKETAIVCELNLVRFSSDILELRYESATTASATVSAIELPFEYEGKGEVTSRFDTVTAGATYVTLPKGICRQVSIVNTNPNDLEIRRVGTTESIALSGEYALPLSCSSAAEFELRRRDQISTGLSVELIIESLNEEQPAWLYLLEAAVTPSDFTTRRLTSYHRDLVAGGQTFSAFNLNHSSVNRTSRLESQNLTIDAVVKDAGDQLWDLIEESNPTLIKVSIYETKAFDPATDQLLYKGIISQVSNPSKDRLRFALKEQNELQDYRLGRGKLSQRCIVNLFSTPCSLLESNFQETGTIVSVGESSDGWPIIDCSLSGSQAVDFFRGGKAIVGNERRAVAFAEEIGSNYRLFLTIPFAEAAVSGAITVTAGCDKSFLTCQAFSNTANFRGAPYLPLENPTLEALEIPQQNIGGKK